MARASPVAAWADASGDAGWSRPDDGDVLRAMDRFHPVADAPEWAASWAEWLYFNGRTPDGRVRVYLTFLVGPTAAASGRRVASVHLQLERDGRQTTYSAQDEIDESALLAGDRARRAIQYEGSWYTWGLLADIAAGIDSALAGAGLAITIVLTDVKARKSKR